MQLCHQNHDIWSNNSENLTELLSRTTHLGIGAHPDDLEIMAYPGIAECYLSAEKWFTGITVTDGAGSARTGPYARFTDTEMVGIRREEQRKAAQLGNYAAQFQLGYSSSEVKSTRRADVVADIEGILSLALPETVFIHQPADKHDTHIAVFHASLHALRALPEANRPKRVLGCEVWRNLDWLADKDKVVLNTSPHPNLAAALIGLFDSQIVGGKRYDLAVPGRWRANATYFDSHQTDDSEFASYAIDLTELIFSEADPAEWMAKHLDTFRQDVIERVSKFG